MQGMAHDMHLGILPGDQLAVEPDVLGWAADWEGCDIGLAP